MGNHEANRGHAPRVLLLKACLLLLWATVTFVFGFFARDLQFVVRGWDFGYWIGAQGAVLVFIAIVTVYAMLMKRLAPEDELPPAAKGPDV